MGISKTKGIIQKDDPIPSRALAWYALKNYLCDKSAIEEGWKLPVVAYNKAIESLDNSGRTPKRNIEYHRSDLGNAQRLTDRYGENFRYCYPYNSGSIWDREKWNNDKAAHMEKFARKTIQSMYDEAYKEKDYEMKKKLIEFALKTESASRIENMLKLAKSEPGI